MGAAPGALQIEVTGQQLVWKFRYAGPDGKFGREKPELVSASTGNPVGLDPTDPASKDDIVSPVIAVPEGREVELILRSQDVTHAFFVRELRLKRRPSLEWKSICISRRRFPAIMSWSARNFAGWDTTEAQHARGDVRTGF